ncbi:MAG: TonB-dependent receptor [Candidatus Zixiibacteriota bacterium]|nr:MAG: TonB-dependent receptor [candidate division Zixibacteria bacterium]
MSTCKKLFFVLPAVLILVLPVLMMAGTTGKIAGIVENLKTGEPIPSATVRVVGTDFVTETDVDGEYFFLNLPAGSYTVSVSVIGFQAIQKEDVRVLLDLTTPVDFEIEQVDIPLKRQIKVYAERPPIQRDLTASRSIVTSDQLAFIPNSITVQSVLTNMAGTIVDRDNNIHVRGGRSGEISHFYEGFSIQDPFIGQAGLRILPQALEEVNLTSGGYSAEYGEALSGIVNAVSKDGSRAYRGKIRLYDGISHPYDINTGTFGGLERISNNAVSYSLSGPVPFILSERANFFLASEYLHDDGYLPHNESETWTHTAKLNYQLTPNLKFTGIGTYYTGEEQLYYHRDVNDISYDFNLDGLSLARDKAYLYGFKSNYNLGKKSILAFSYNHFYTERLSAPEKLIDTYYTDWDGYSVDENGVYNGTIHEDNYQLSQDYFFTGFTSGDDYDPTYRKRYTRYNAFAANLTSQIDKFNEIRFGAEYRIYDVFWDMRQFFNARPYGERYEHSPVYGVLYFQDKLELQDFVINAGIRWDYISSEVEYWEDPLSKSNRTTSGVKSHFSPRLGVSHPIAENTIVRFNYGYYYQVPNYTFMYTNLDADLTSGFPLVGNPDLRAEQTISYELGLNHMINEDFRLDVTTYYKDIENLVATREIGIFAGSPVTQFVNEDYASAKGVDVTLEKVASGNLSGTFVYSYMIAKGNSSSAYEGYYDYITEPEGPDAPVKEYPLSFDQRHTATLNITYRVPHSWKGSLFGVTIPGSWGLNALGHYGSGMPYTVTDEFGMPMGGINEGRLPAYYSVDMRFFKDIFLPHSESYFSFFIEVENLFDRRNVVDVYSNTGLPDDDGRRYDLTADPDGDGPATAEDANEFYRLLAKDPTNYSAPRTVRFGLEFNF